MPGLQVKITLHAVTDLSLAVKSIRFYLVFTFIVMQFWPFSMLLFNIAKSNLGKFESH